VIFDTMPLLAPAAFANFLNRRLDLGAHLRPRHTKFARASSQIDKSQNRVAEGCKLMLRYLQSSPHTGKPMHAADQVGATESSSVGQTFRHYIGK
jgi:hypothetical protein